jgi:hypothetical protein
VFGGVALLGEVGKVTSVSTHRFASISTSGNGLMVGLRGKPAEAVTLFYATGSAVAGYKCATRLVTIGTDGTATASLTRQ